MSVAPKEGVLRLFQFFLDQSPFIHRCGKEIFSNRISGTYTFGTGEFSALSYRFFEISRRTSFEICAISNRNLVQKILELICEHCKWPPIRKEDFRVSKVQKSVHWSCILWSFSCLFRIPLHTPKNVTAWHFSCHIHLGLPSKRRDLECHRNQDA